MEWIWRYFADLFYLGAEIKRSSAKIRRTLLFVQILFCHQIEGNESKMHYFTKHELQVLKKYWCKIMIIGISNLLF